MIVGILVAIAVLVGAAFWYRRQQQQKPQKGSFMSSGSQPIYEVQHLVSRIYQS